MKLLVFFPHSLVTQSLGVSELTSLLDASETGVLESASLFGVSDSEVSDTTSLVDASKLGYLILLHSSVFLMLKSQMPLHCLMLRKLELLNLLHFWCF